MQIEQGPQLEMYRQKERAKIWALLLCIGYGLTTVSEWLMLQLTPDENGLWVAKAAEQPSIWVIVFFLVLGLFCLICTVGLVIASIIDRVKGTSARIRPDEGITGADVMYTLGWVQSLQIVLLFLYAFFLPYPIFSGGTIGSLLEASSLQVFVLIVAAFLFWRRGRQLGFRKPKQMMWMVLTLIGMFLFMAIALDFLVTLPVSDWLDLSLSSEREAGIEQEITQAKANNWLNGLMSILAIGVMAPIAEEILFRGVIQTFFIRKLGAFIGILLSSFWFAAIHIDLGLFAPLFTIGLFLGFLRYRFDSIWPAIILHSLNNVTSVLYYMF